MKQAEMEKELIFLYGEAIKAKDFHLALDIFRQGIDLGIEEINLEKETEK